MKINETYHPVDTVCFKYVIVEVNDTFIKYKSKEFPEMGIFDMSVECFNVTFEQCRH
jgi:hypothetical protein